MDRFPGLFVGRQSELADLWEWLESGSGPLLIEGDNGIGKSRLVSEFAEMAGRSGWFVRLGRAYEAPPALPLLPFAHILGASAPEVERELELLADLGPVSQEVQAPELRALFLNRLAERIRVVWREKCILVVEDIHWADPLSLLLITHLVESGTTGPLLLTSRPTRARQVARLARLVHRLPLGPLDGDSLTVLARDICGVGTLAPHEVEWLRELTTGSPLFATEVLRAFRRSGILPRASAAQAAAELGIPARLADLLERRVDELSGRAREVVATAACLRGPIDPELLRHAAGLRREDLEQDLAAAVGLGLLAVEYETPERRIRFVQPFLRRSVYEANVARASAHARIAKALREGDFEDEASFYAYHVAHSDNPEDQAHSVEAAAEAAGAAERIFAFESAAQLWRLAIERAKGDAARAPLYFRLAAARRAAGDWDAAARAFEQAYARALKSGAPELAAEAAYQVGEMARFRLNAEVCREWLEKTLALDATGASRRIRATTMLGSALASIGEGVRARELMEAGLALAAETASERPFAAFWASVGYAALSEIRRGSAVLADGLAYAREESDRYWASLLASLQFHADMSDLRRGNFEALLSDVESLAEPRDASVLIRQMVTANLLHAYEGRWDAVLASAAEWMSHVRLAGKFQVATARLYWGEASYCLGDAEGAEEAMRRALPALEAEEATGAMYYARVLLARGDLVGAQALLERYAPGIMSSPRLAAGPVLLAENAARIGDQRLSSELLPFIEGISRPMVVGHTPLSVRRVLGVTLAALSSWPAAFEAFEVALGELQEGGAYWELLLTHLDYADARDKRRRRGDEKKAISLRARAGALARRHGLPVDLLQQRLAVPPGARGSIFGLSSREDQVLQEMARAKTNAEIADTLGVSAHTVDRHVEAIFSKMGVGSRTEAVIKAFREGIIEGAT